MRAHASNRRILWTIPAFVLLLIAVTARFVQVQWLQRDRFFAHSHQHRTALTARITRGRILDRNGNELAVTRDVYSLCIYPRYYRELAERRHVPESEAQDRKRGLVDLLAAHLDVPDEELWRAVDSPRGFVWVRRHLESTVIRSMERALNEQDSGWWPKSGLDYVVEERRAYPRGELAAHVIGHTDLDGKGIDGIELAYDDQLRSRMERRTTFRDGKGRTIDPRAIKAAETRATKSVVLTIDEHVQSIVETELQRQVEAFRAVGAVGIVMRPRNGEVLAMANYPSYDLNHYNDPDIPEWVRRNRAIWWPYEPGSAFKLLTAAALLDSGRMRPSDQVFCENGTYVPHPTMKPIRDVHPYGHLSLSEVVVKSSNIGMLKAASEHLTLEELREYIQRFRLDATTGIDLPYERFGSTAALSDRSGYALYYVPWGQGISLTPLQMLTVVNTIANGGVLVQPRIVREALGPDGQTAERRPVVSLGRIIRPEAARQVTDIMVEVVRTGTGRPAQVPGIDVAGKTGTSQKADPDGSGYLQDAFVSTFIGFFPARQPLYSVITLVDEPQDGHYGGQVAAPVFQRIAEELLRYEQMQPVIERVATADQGDPPDPSEAGPS